MIPEGFGQTIKLRFFFSQNFALWKNSNIGKTFRQLWKFFYISLRFWERSNSLLCMCMQGLSRDMTTLPNCWIFLKIKIVSLNHLIHKKFIALNNMEFKSLKWRYWLFFCMQRQWPYCQFSLSTPHLSSKLKLWQLIMTFPLTRVCFLFNFVI